MQDQLKPATVLSHFEIISHLGSGGMGAVYRARDISLDREVAIKIIPTEASRDGSRMQRFVQEAKAASALNHPNIVTVYEIGSADDGGDRRQFIVMELVEGETLRELVTQRVSTSRIVDILTQVSDGLVKAHAAGIVHRDLKPENIMITRDGLAKILDFGLAKLMTIGDTNPNQQTAIKQNLTREGTIVGTVNYMSPEQLRGAAVDHRSDIFSLGCILYEMACGRQPFRGISDADTMHNILFEEPPPLADADLDLVARKALAKRSEDRYQSAKDLADGLRRARQTVTTAPAIASRPRDRRKWITGLLIGATLIAGTVAFLTWKPFRRPSTPSFAQMSIVPLPGTSDALESAISADGKYLAYRRENGSVVIRQIASGSEVEPLRNRSDSRGGLAFSPDGGYLYYTEGPSLFSIPVLGGGARRILDNVDKSPVSFSPDGKRLAFLRGGSVFTAGIEGSDVKRVAGTTMKYTFGDIAWSGDGKSIAAALRSFQGAIESRIQLVRLNVPDTVADAATARNFPGVWTLIRGVAWFPDGSAVIAAVLPTLGAVRQLVVTEYGAGAPRRITNDLFNYFGVSVSKDGTVASVQIDQRWRIVEVPLAPGSPQREIAEGAGSFPTLCAAKDGEVIYSSLTGENLSLWSTAAGMPRQLTSGPEDDFTPAISPDGRSIAYAAQKGHRVTIWRMDRDGSNQRQVSVGNNHGSPQWSADGREIFFTSRDQSQPKLMRIKATGGSAVALPASYVIRPSPSPDGAKIAAVGDGFRLGIFEARSGATIRLFDTKINNGPMRWTADSRAVAYIGSAGGIFNIYLQPIHGGTPQPLTHLEEGAISQFDWGKEQRSVICARIRESRRVVLISGWR